MHINQKIKILIERTGMNLKEFHRKILEVNNYDDSTINYLTLYRTVKNLTKIRESTLFQIALALGMQPKDIKKGTEQQDEYARYDFNEKAYIEYPNYDLPFLAGTLVLLPGAKTALEQNPKEKGPFVKWIFGLRSTVTCIVNPEEEIVQKKIKYRESFSFDSTQPHYFVNDTKSKAMCVIVQHPKYL